MPLIEPRPSIVHIPLIQMRQLDLIASNSTGASCYLEIKFLCFSCLVELFRYEMVWKKKSESINVFFTC